MLAPEATEVREQLLAVHLIRHCIPTKVEECLQIVTVRHEHCKAGNCGDGVVAAEGGVPLAQAQM